MGRITLDTDKVVDWLWWLGGAAGRLFNILFSASNADNDNALIKQGGTNGIDGTAYSAHVLSSDGSTGQINYSITGNIEYVDVWINPDTTTEPILDFGTGKTIEISAGTVTVTGLGTNTIQVDRVVSSTMVASKWQHLRIDLDAPVAITEMNVFKNATAFGALDIKELTSNLFAFEMLEGKESIIFDSVQKKAATLTGGVAWVTGLSGLENSETHDGLPQSLTKKWNGYLTSSGGAIGINAIAEYSFIVGDFYESTIVYNGEVQYFGGRDTVTDWLRINGDGVTVAFRPRGGSGYVETLSTPIQIGQIITGRVERTSSTQYTIIVNSESFVITDSDVTRVRRIFQSSRGICLSYNINNTNQGTNLSGFSSAISIADLTLKTSIPEDPNNLTNDIFVNAIAPSGETFRADGLSYIDANVTSSANYNSVIEIVAEDINVYESQSVNTIYSNRDNTANQRGQLAYLDASDRPVFLLQRDTATRVQVQSNVAVSAGDKASWKSDGTGDASGVTIEINDVAVATTTLQDQDISAGIVSAANAQFFVDLDGTANKFKGTATIIKVL